MSNATIPHNFDSQSMSHQIAAALVKNHNIDPDIIVYRTKCAETRPGVTVYTNDRTWCYILDSGVQIVTFNLVADTGEKTFGTYTVDIANGELDLAYITVDDAAKALAGMLAAITYTPAQ